VPSFTRLDCDWPQVQAMKSSVLSIMTHSYFRSKVKMGFSAMCSLRVAYGDESEDRPRFCLRTTASVLSITIYSFLGLGREGAFVCFLSCQVKHCTSSALIIHRINRLQVHQVTSVVQSIKVLSYRTACVKKPVCGSSN
jgi:hypothetical protein